jgi:hypothetical protein
MIITHLEVVSPLDTVGATKWGEISINATEIK